jgi:hypothetical protein
VTRAEKEVLAPKKVDSTPEKWCQENNRLASKPQKRGNVNRKSGFQRQCKNVKAKKSDVKARFSGIKVRFFGFYIRLTGFNIR